MRLTEHILTCNECDYEWKARTATTVYRRQCPKCRSYKIKSKETDYNPNNITTAESPSCLPLTEGEKLHKKTDTKSLEQLFEEFCQRERLKAEVKSLKKDIGKHILQIDSFNRACWRYDIQINKTTLEALKNIRKKFAYIRKLVKSEIKNTDDIDDSKKLVSAQVSEYNKIVAPYTQRIENEKRLEAKRLRKERKLEEQRRRMLERRLQARRVEWFVEQLREWEVYESVPAEILAEIKKRLQTETEAIGDWVNVVGLHYRTYVRDVPPENRDAGWKLLLENIKRFDTPREHYIFLLEQYRARKKPIDTVTKS